jgi:polygalacturonase
MFNLDRSFLMPYTYRAILTALLFCCAVPVVPVVAAGAAAATPPPPPLPMIPHRLFNITRYGAAANQTTPSTAAIQTAINRCSRAGGGVVLIPRGTFLCGPIRLNNNIDLRLAKGAVLKMLSYSQYPITHGRYHDFIRASNDHDIAITGTGMITGQGAPWWAAYRRRPDGTVPKLPHRPQMISMNNITRLLIEGVTLHDPANTHISIQNECRDVTIEHILIHTPHNSPNTDGIDLSGHDVLISHCRISDGDDCIAIGGSGHRSQNYFESQNIVVTHCAFGYGHGMSIGSFTSGGIRNLLVENCTFNRTTAGIRLKSNLGRAGLVENLTYRNITMRSVRWPIFISSYYPHAPKHSWAQAPKAIGRFTPIWRNIRIINLTSVGSPVAGHIIGLPEMPVQNVLLRNVHIVAKTPMIVIDARGIVFQNSSIHVRHGNALIIHNAQVTGINPRTGQPRAMAITAAR